MLEWFGVFWTVSDIVFKADILPTCDFFDLSEYWNHILDSRKQLLLQNGKDLADACMVWIEKIACETMDFIIMALDSTSGVRIIEVTVYAHGL